MNWPFGRVTRRFWTRLAPRLRPALGPLLAANWLAFAPAQEILDRDGPAEYTVMLAAPSVGERLRAARADGEERSFRRADASSMALLRRAVVRAQEPVRARLEGLGIRVFGATQNVANALFVRATAEQAEAIARTAGVRSVVRSRRYRPLLPGAIDVVGLPAGARSGANARAGDGLKIAIIDSGIDSEHEAFRDDGLAPLAGYPKGRPEHLRFANNKVVAVRSYVESLNSGELENSSPDDVTPIDYSGHGTAVAMIAAGRRVDTPIGPVEGVAPAARIGVYKVFGTPGVSDDTSNAALLGAVEDAITDGMDILNLSLGFLPFDPWNGSGPGCLSGGGGEPCDPVAWALESAVLDYGRVVVASAGNDADVGLRPREPAAATITSPGNTPVVITVGATRNAQEYRESVRVGETSFEARIGLGPGLAAPLTARAASAADFDNSLGCSPYPEGALTGRIVIVDRGTCYFVRKVEFADAAGAVGVLVIDRLSNQLVTMTGLATTDIPAFFLGAADGEDAQRLLANPGSRLTLDPTPTVVPDEWTRIVSFSSRGPALALHPKPDLVAPGVVVYTAAPRYDGQGFLQNPSGFRETIGTSFSSPFVAGAAALAWQAHPEMTAREISSTLINTASQTILEDDEPARLAAVGAGLLNVEGALRTRLTTVPALIGFGAVQGELLPIRRRLRVTNHADRTQRIRVTVEPRDPDSRARVTVDGRRSLVVDLAAGGSAVLLVALDGRSPAPGSYEGRLRIEILSGLGSDLTVPFLYVAGDNEPYNALVIQGRDATGIAGEPTTRSLTARVIDRFGAPVVRQPVDFRVESGFGNIGSRYRTSSASGLIHARVRYGGGPGLQSVVARIGGLEIPFYFEATGSKPTISSVENDASGLSPAGIAPGSLVAIRGSGFSRYEGERIESSPPRPLGLSRKGVTVAFDAPAAGLGAPGRVVEAGPDRIVVQVPWELAGQERAYVKVRSGTRSEPFPVHLAEADPGIYHNAAEFDELGIVRAIRENGSRISRAWPARPGETVRIRMTGNGPVQTPLPTGTPAAAPNPLVHRPTVRVDGAEAEVLDAGLVPGLAGVYEVRLVVPADAPRGDRALTVEINGAVSNTVRLPVQ